MGAEERRGVTVGAGSVHPTAGAASSALLVTRTDSADPTAGGSTHTRAPAMTLVPRARRLTKHGVRLRERANGCQPTVRYTYAELAGQSSATSCSAVRATKPDALVKTQPSTTAHLRRPG